MLFIFYIIESIKLFYKPGAQRVVASSNRDELLAAAYVNAKGKLAVIIINSSDDRLITICGFMVKQHLQQACRTALPHW